MTKKAISRRTVHKLIAGILITIMVSSLTMPGIGAVNANQAQPETSVAGAYIGEVDSGLDKRVIDDGASNNELQFPVNLDTLISDKSVNNHGNESGSNRLLAHGGGNGGYALEGETLAGSGDPAGADTASSALANATGENNSEAGDDAIRDEATALAIEKQSSDIYDSLSDNASSEDAIEEINKRDAGADAVANADENANEEANANSDTNANEGANANIDENEIENANANENIEKSAENNINTSDIDNIENSHGDLESGNNEGETDNGPPTDGDSPSATTPGQGSGANTGGNTGGSTNGENSQATTTDDNKSENGGSTDENESQLGEEIQVNTGSGGNPSGNETPSNTSAPAELDPTGTTENAIEFDEEPVIDELDDEPLDGIYDDLYDLTLDADTFDQEVAKFQADIWGKKVGEQVFIRSTGYLVLRRETINSKNLVLLLETSSNKVVRRGQRDYEGSGLQTSLTNRYNEYQQVAQSYYYKHLRAMAVVPDLGDFNSITATSEPTTIPASTVASGKDIMFAPSYMDLYNFGKGKKNNFHPALSTFYGPYTHWSRTPTSNPAFIYGWKSNGANDPGNGWLDQGIQILADYVYLNGAVWVNTSSLDHNITVKSIDINNDALIGQNTNAGTVEHNGTFYLSSTPTYPNRVYTGQWKIEGTSIIQTGPVFLSGVDSSKTIILYYANSKINVRINYLDKTNKANIDSFETMVVDYNTTFTLDKPKSIMNYVFANEWNEGNAYNAVKAPPITIPNIKKDTTINLFYTYQEFVVRHEITVHFRNKHNHNHVISEPEKHIMEGAKSANEKPIFDYSIIPEFEGYSFTDTWKVDSLDSELIEFYMVYIFDVKSDRTLYLFYEAETVDILVTKTVTGEYANKTLPFKFNFQVLDFDNSFGFGPGMDVELEGGAIEGSGATAPPDVTLQLDLDAKISFSLKHGQTLRIKNIPRLAMVLLKENIDDDVNSNYIQSYEDSVYPGEIFYTHDVGLVDLKLGKDKTRTISFTNDRIYIPPMGITENTRGTYALSIVAVLFASMMFSAKTFIKKRKMKA